jgi:uncharacterized integral membrane protein
MNARGVAYIVAAIVLGVLVVANWTVLTAPTELSFIVTQFQAPLIILMLLVAGLIALAGFVIHALRRREWAQEQRALRKDLDAVRLRAEHEEESRVRALRVSMERELATLRAQLDRLLDGQAVLLGRPPSVTRVAPRPPESQPVGSEPPPLEPALIPPRTVRN